MRFLGACVAVIALAALTVSYAGAARQPVRFSVFAHTNLRLTDVIWTGSSFLYVDNTTNTVSASGPAGLPLRPFARMPRQVEETRCAVAPNAGGFSPGTLYCHAPNNVMYRISPDGAQVTPVATLTGAPRSDGALAFDTVGKFGYALIVATGRSGGSSPAGGTVYAMSAAGSVRRIGSYGGPGGADELAVAPADFGAAAGDVLLAIDAGKQGRIEAMDVNGHARAVATLPDGPNPIAVLTSAGMPARGTARAGLYVTDTLSHNVYFAPAADFTMASGEVVVGSELRGLFWALKPRGSGFAAVPLATTLPAKHYNFEGATFIGG